MKVVVLGGGDSPEREVSLRSSAAVTKALEASGYEVLRLDPAQDDLGLIPADTVVLPILHGVNCEDGVIQRELEARSLPYLGATSEVSALCFDKARTLEKLSAAGVTIPGGEVVSADSYRSHELAKKPHVLKTTKGGSSLGTYLVHDPTDIDDVKVAEVFALGPEALIEELIEGTEITVPILDGQAMTAIEIRPPDGEEFDYENKYNGETAEICPPESIDDKKRLEAQALAEQVHQLVGCRHLSRTDMMMRPSGELIVLEINTIPGLTDRSLLPVSAKHDGLTMPMVADKFVQMVIRDYNLKEAK